MNRRKLIISILAFMTVVSMLCFTVGFEARANTYKTDVINVGAPSYPRMDGQVSELFSYIDSPIDWNKTESVEIDFTFAVDMQGDVRNYNDQRHFAIVMNDIGSGQNVNYLDLKFYQGSKYYPGIQFDFKSDSQWNGCFQIAVFGGNGQLNSGAYSHGWGNPFGANPDAGTKESGDSIANLSTLLFYNDYIKLTITRDSEYYNFNFFSNNDQFPTNYTFSVKRECVTSFGDFVNAPYIGFYACDFGSNLSSDVGFNITNVKITEKPEIPLNKITVPFNYKTMLAGQSVDYEASVEIVPGSASDSTEVIYTSSNEAVAKVENGKLVAVGEGKAVITATTQDNVSAHTTVNVVATLGDSDLKYVNNYQDKTTVISVENGIYYSAQLVYDPGNDYSMGKLYIDQPIEPNKIISFDFTPVIEGQWTTDKTYYNIILNDIYDPVLGGPNIDKLNINDPSTNGLKGMQFRFVSDKGWMVWNYCIQYVKIARDGNILAQPYSAEFRDPKINAVAQSLWLDQKVNVKIVSTQDKYILTLTAYDENGNLTDNCWVHEYDKTLVEFPHNPYLGIMVNNYDTNSKTMGFVITNFMNGYVKEFRINEKGDTPLELTVGENDPLTVTQIFRTTPPQDFDRSITWESSNTEVVEIGENGKLIAKKPGNAVITARDSEGNVDTIDVAIDVKSLTVTSEKTINAYYGTAGAQIVVVVDPADVEVLYISSDENIVKVGNCKLTYTGIGSATITVRAGMKTETVYVNVDVESLTLNITELEMDKFDVVTLRAECGGAPGLVWTSSDTSVITVDQSGKVTAVGVGTATITVSIGSKSATCVVTVKAEEQQQPLPTDGGKDTEKKGCKTSLNRASLSFAALLLVMFAAFKKRRKE